MWQCQIIFKLIIRFVWTGTWWLLGCSELLTNMDSFRIKLQGEKLTYIFRISVSISLNAEVFDIDQTLTSCSIRMSSIYIALCYTKDAHARSINPRDVWYSRIKSYADLDSAYDKDWKLCGHLLFLANSMKFPLITYSKFVWLNFIWPDRCLFWWENIWWLCYHKPCTMVCMIDFIKPGAHQPQAGARLFS